MIWTRVELLIAFGVLLVAAVVVARAVNRRGVRRLLDGSGPPVWDSLGEAPDGRRTLVSFSTPSCAACHATQAPAVRAVEERLGVDGVRVIRVDAVRRPAVARAFGVMTVPSTVVLAPAGQVVAVNYGFAPTGRLVEQLESA